MGLSAAYKLVIDGVKSHFTRRIAYVASIALDFYIRRLRDMNISGGHRYLD